LAQDYEGAAVRHFEDAETLRLSGRVDNAGHLIGFAAECAIKHRISSIRPGANSPQGHLPEILIAARKHLGARSGYTGMYDIVKGDIFRGWAVNRRYDKTGHTDPADLIVWFATTKRLLAAASVRVRK
jgi:hypothetical protein